MSAIKYSLLGIIAYLFFLLWQLPINYVLARLSPLPAQVQIYGARGTLFNGEASAIEKGLWRFENINWTLYKFPLIKGRLEFINIFNNPDQASGRIRAGINLFRRPYLSRSRAHFPITALEPLWRPLALNLGGWINIKFDYVNWSEQDLSAKGQITLENLSWENNQLGNVLATIETVEIKTAENNSYQAISGQFSDQGGTVQLQGQLQLDITGQWQIKGTLTPRADTPPNIRQMLVFLGQPNQEGQYLLSFNGKLKK